MPMRGVLAFGAALLCLTGCIGGKIDPRFTPREAEGWTTPLQELGIDGSMAHLAMPANYEVHQVSSYDRTGGDADDQYAFDTYEGGVILADLQGPGMISRIWTRNPWGTLYVYVDDMQHPVMTLPFADLFRADLEFFSPAFNLFAPPFVGEDNGGFYSYVPIPYAERCRLIVAGGNEPLAYQVTHLKFPVGTPIQSFNISLSGDDVQYFRRWRDEWENRDFRYHKRKTEKLHKSANVLWPHNNYHVYSLEGPATITELEVSAKSIHPQLLDKVWLAIYFDGQTDPGVLAPLGMLFAKASPNGDNYSSAAIGNIDGRMWLRFPMPFRNYAQVRIVNDTDQLVEFDYAITYREGDVKDARYFFARYDSGATEAGMPYTVADLHGNGHYVGTALAVDGFDSLSFLDGDDMMTIDGDPVRTIYGTNTDDYFNAGWGFTAGGGSGPAHGATYKKTSRPMGFGAFRAHITDPVPFSESFNLKFEHGPGNSAPGVPYRAVVYWYQDALNPELPMVAASTSMKRNAPDPDAERAAYPDFNREKND